jgi:transposase
MEAIVERAAGLDVHQGSVVACAIIGAAGRRPTKEVRTFGTMTRDLMALRVWLLEVGVTHVGMEGTGVHWQPVHAALEGRLTVIVGNAAHMRHVPGRKTDVKDAEWIADLVRHGLVRAIDPGRPAGPDATAQPPRGPIVPPPEVRVLRELIRHRKALVGNLVTERNRTLKLLESANIKLAGVMSSVFGVSGMLMLKALAEGGSAPAAMAELAKRRLRRKCDQLALALDGHLAEHQRFLLKMHIRRLEEIGRDLTEVEAAIGTAMRPFAAQQALLVTIPGVDALTAAAIVAEIGVDMAAFGTAKRLAAWAGVCPANHESAGRQKKRGTRKGNPYLKTVLMTAAVCASRTRGSYLRDKFHRLRARMGTKKAAMAVAHKILLAVFHMLQRVVAFADLGADYLDRIDKHRSAKRPVRRLDARGYEVMLRPKIAA